MTNDLEKRTQDLLEKFDGKITETDWKIGSSVNDDNNPIIVLDGFFGGKEASEIDIKAMSSVPRTLNIIKELVAEKTHYELKKREIAEAHIGFKLKIMNLEDEISHLKSLLEKQND